MIAPCGTAARPRFTSQYIKELPMPTANITQAPIRSPDRFFISGEWVIPSSDAKIDIIAPATEEVYFSVAEAKEADVNRAVSAAREAFDRGPWPRMSPNERAVYLRAIELKLKARAIDVVPGTCGCSQGNVSASPA
jgi:aldehyde dehydrogenase (NAD+)